MIIASTRDVVQWFANVVSTQATGVQIPVTSKTITESQLTTGNGNCLYNCVSIWLTENESLHVYLRMLTAIELYENAAFYGQHPKLLSVQTSLKVGEDTSFRQILSSNGTSSMNENISVPDLVKFTAAIKDKAIGTCKLSKYATLVHIMP